MCAAEATSRRKGVNERHDQAKPSVWIEELPQQHTEIRFRFQLERSFIFQNPLKVKQTLHPIGELSVNVCSRCFKRLFWMCPLSLRVAPLRMVRSDSDSPSTSPVRIPSVRGMLLARTHFDVLGFDCGSFLPSAVSDEEVQLAYRRCTRAVDLSNDLGSAVALCRVEAAFRALKTLEMRELTWKHTAVPVKVEGPVTVPAGDENEVVGVPSARSNKFATHKTSPTSFDKRLGRLISCKNPVLARLPWNVEHAVERSVAAGPADGYEMIAALKAKNTIGKENSFFVNKLNGTNEMNETNAREEGQNSISSLRDELVFFVREAGYPDALPKLTAFWITGEASDFALRYRFLGKKKTTRTHDGEWRLSRGNIQRLVRMKPTRDSMNRDHMSGSNAQFSLKLIAVEHQQPGREVLGWILTASNDNDDVNGWLRKMKNLIPNYSQKSQPTTPPRLERGKGNLRGTAPSPVRRHLVPR